MSRLRLGTVESMLRRYAGLRLTTIPLASLEGGAGRDGAASKPRRSLEYLGTMGWALKALPQRITVHELRRIAGPRVWPLLREYTGELINSLGVPDGDQELTPRFSVAECWVLIDQVYGYVSRRLESCRELLRRASDTTLKDRVTDRVTLQRASEVVRELAPVEIELKELRDVVYRGTDLEEDLMALQRDPRMVDLWREGSHG